VKHNKNKQTNNYINFNTNISTVSWPTLYNCSKITDRDVQANMADRVLEKLVQQDESDCYRSFHAGSSFGQLSVEAQWVFRRSSTVNTKVAAHVSRTCTQGVLFCV